MIPKAEAERELRRRINENLKNIYSGKYRREREAKAKEKGNELSKAFPWEIQLGYVVLERRQFSRRFNQLIRRKEISEEEFLELQCQLDDYDAELEGYTDTELKRFVRLWNKSRKVRYKI